MKISLEQIEQDELEIMIRGNIGAPKVQEIIKAIQTAGGLAKVFLYQDSREYIFNPEEIVYFEAEGNKIFAYVAGQRLETRHKLYELAEILAGKGFVQINKGMVVNIHQIRSVEGEFSGNHILVLKDGKTKLVLSRKYLKAFRQFVMEV